MKKIFAVTIAILCATSALAQAPYTDGTALTDGASWQATLKARVSQILQSMANEFLINVQGVLAPTGATAPYEKDLIICHVRNDDVSAGAVLKDGVCGDFRANIGPNNPYGRVWALYAEAGTMSGGNGHVAAVEIGGNNTAPPERGYGLQNSKYLVSFVAGEHPGNTDFTGVAGIAGGSAHFLRGFTFERAAFQPGSSVIEVIDNATGGDDLSIQEDGSIYAAHTYPRFINQPTMPALNPGEAAMWGDTAHGKIYLIFNWGGGTIKTRLK